MANNKYNAPVKGKLNKRQRAEYFVAGLVVFLLPYSISNFFGTGEPWIIEIAICWMLAFIFIFVSFVGGKE